jgi:hypothetical protein
MEFCSGTVFDETSRKEIDMFLHLPIAILATLSPIAVSDAVPKFDIAKECRYEGEYTCDMDRCSRDEAIALQQLQKAWTKFAGADKKTCVGETTIGDFVSYVELLTCLEMASEVVSANNNPQDPRTKSGSGPTRPGRTGVTVAEAHRP